MLARMNVPSKFVSEMKKPRWSALTFLVAGIIEGVFYNSVYVKPQQNLYDFRTARKSPL